MNVNRVRSLLLLVNLGLAAGTGYTVYKEFTTKKVRVEQTAAFYEQLKRDLDSAPKPVAKDPTRVSIKTGDLVDLTGEKPKPPVVESAPVAASSRALTPVADLLRIVTIAVHPDRYQSHVTVAKKTPPDPPGERLTFGEGEVIPFANDVVVSEIRSDTVGFKNGDRVEWLPIEVPGGSAGPGGPTASRSSPSDPGNRPFITYVESKKDSGTITIKSGGSTALSREGEQVLEGVVFSSTDAASGGKALRVDKVPPDSVLAKHGVQDGDVLVSVNGIRMSTKSEVVEYAKKNRTLQVFDVAIQRRGNILHKIVNIER